MDSGSIQALFAGLSFAKEAFESALKGKIDAETQRNISEAMAKLDSAQSTIYQMRSEMFDLQERNHALTEEIRKVVAWQDRVGEYELVKTTGSAIVYRFKGQPNHYCCPKCVESEQIQILQDGRGYSGSYTCPGCGSHFKIDPVRPVPTPRVKGSPWA